MHEVPPLFQSERKCKVRLAFILMFKRSLYLRQEWCFVYP